MLAYPVCIRRFLIAWRVGRATILTESCGCAGHNFVGTEQILLGLIGESTGIAAKVLKSMGVNLKVSMPRSLACLTLSDLSIARIHTMTTGSMCSVQHAHVGKIFCPLHQTSQRILLGVSICAGVAASQKSIF